MSIGSPVAFEGSRGQRVFFEASTPPRFTTENYETVLFSEGIGRSFINSLTVTMPGHHHPDPDRGLRGLRARLDAVSRPRDPHRRHHRPAGRAAADVADTAAQALQRRWRLFFGVPAKTYLGIWLAHTGFGLPFAIYLLRSYIAGLPQGNHGIGAHRRRQRLRDLSSRSCCRSPSRCSPPLRSSSSSGSGTTCWSPWFSSAPAQNQLVLTGKLNALLGSRGGDWEILTTSAFVTIIVPLDRVFLAATLFRPRPARGLRQRWLMTMPAVHEQGRREPAVAPDRDWWRGAVIYQIYPRSFQDSNGDGIGDLRGHPTRLPHIASLGVDAIWISPFFKSPMKDFGYDVSDYRDVDPMFGTLDDFDALVAEAHRLGLRVMIDEVLSHTVRRASLVPGKPVVRDNPKRRLVRLGRRQAGRHAAQQLAVDLRRLGLGSGTRVASNITCTTSSPSSRTSTSTTRRSRTRCST
jgi:hypothetical protein